MLALLGLCVLLFAGPYATLTYITPFLGQVTGVSVALLYFVAEVPLLVALALAIWGIAGFGMVPSLQYRIVAPSGPGADLAGHAARLGHQRRHRPRLPHRRLAPATHGASAPVIVGIVVSAIAAPASWATGLLRPPAADQAPAQPSDDSLDPSPTAA
ncbi:hypothetical protein ACQP2P_30185 [Dactylosporangium sp. CA-139114]|uniref:hypothetical protein n=1 Tax=Dactylosporangium sp. CA-139114 TaxID=3239931 RepID=UPI003D96D65D